MKVDPGSHRAECLMSRSSSEDEALKSIISWEARLASVYAAWEVWEELVWPRLEWVLETGSRKFASRIGVSCSITWSSSSSIRASCVAYWVRVTSWGVWGVGGAGDHVHIYMLSPWAPIQVGIGKWTPMKIHTQMIKPSPHTDVTRILTNKATSQTEISEPLLMGWTGGKNVTILHVVTCEKPPLKVKTRIMSSKQGWKKRQRMNITSSDLWCRKKW